MTVLAHRLRPTVPEAEPLTANTQDNLRLAAASREASPYGPSVLFPGTRGLYGRLWSKVPTMMSLCRRQAR